MLVNELEKLIQIPSVCGFEESIIDYLHNRWIKENLPVHKYEWYWVILWNPHASTYYIAHIDEVGGRVSYIDDTTIHIESKWRISPSMFIWRDIEIITKDSIIPGLISSPNLLSMEQNDIHNLQVTVDPIHRSKIQRGNPIRYKPLFQDLPASIIATGLDNKLGVVIAMELALKNKDTNFLQHNAICLCGQEEDKNQWAMYFMQQFMPKRQLILDISPMNNEISNNAHQALFISKTADYQLDEQYVKLCEKAWFENIQTALWILNRSEAMQYQNQTRWVGINLNIPVYNYHLGSYFVYKDAIDHFEKSLSILIESLPQIE